MSRILVLGAGGMLGHKLCRHLPGHEVFGTVRGPVEDYAPLGEVFKDVALLGGVDALEEGLLARTIDRVNPDVVINCIGIVKQLKEAANTFLSVAVNAYLPHRLALLCARVGSRLIHISTDCVFDGATGGYRESDISNARDLYGKSKFLGETDATETAAITLRTSIIGRELKRPTNGLIDWFLAQGGKTVRGFDRAIYSGFSTTEMARIMAIVIERHSGLSGLYHVASVPISKYKLLLLVREVFGLDVKIERDEDFACDRSLLMDRFSEATGYVAPGWERMIREMHEETTAYPASVVPD